MATDLRQLLATITTDADWRAWGSGIHDQLTTIGLVQTADTGQIDWATSIKPGQFAFAGYEVWRFNDSLQATKPVFIKLQYTVGISGRPSFQANVGTATNGAGSLTGQLGGNLACYPGNVQAGTLPSYCSGSPSRLNLAFNVHASDTAFPCALLVERTKSASGNDTGDGIVTSSLTVYGTAGFRAFQVIPFSGPVPAQGPNMAASLDGGVSSVGPNVALSPTIAPLGKVLFASWCVYKTADIGGGVPVAADHLGASHTLLPLGAGINPFGIVQGTTTGHSLAILWE